MKRILNGIKFDILSHYRNGIYLIYAMISILYIIAIRMVPNATKDVVSTIILFSDPSLLGFFFIGALILLEKTQKTMENIFVTPLRISEFIISKTIAFSIVTLFFSLVIVFFSYGFDFNLVFLFFGVLLSSVLFTLLGFGVAVKVKTLNGYLWIAPLFVAAAFFPVLENVGLYKTNFFYLIPGKASLILIEAAFKRVELWQLTYALITLVLSIVLVYQWSHHVFKNYIIMGMGGK